MLKDILSEKVVVEEQVRASLEEVKLESSFNVEKEDAAPSFRSQEMAVQQQPRLLVLSGEKLNQQ